MTDKTNNLGTLAKLAGVATTALASGYHLMLGDTTG